MTRCFMGNPFGYRLCLVEENREAALVEPCPGSPATVVAERLAKRMPYGLMSVNITVNHGTGFTSMTLEQLATER